MLLNVRDITRGDLRCNPKRETGLLKGNVRSLSGEYSWNVLRAPVINMSVTSKASYFSYA